MRPLVAAIDLAAIRHNHAIAKRCAPGRQVFAVIKANAYGHGVREVVTTLYGTVDGFAVATLEEAAEVRAMHAEARILVLQGCFFADELPIAAQLGLDVVVHSVEQAEALLGVVVPRPLNLWLGLDCGLHGLGLTAREVRHWQGRLSGAGQVAELNLLGQLGCAESRGHPLIEQQIGAFVELLDLAFDQRTLANSAALLTLPAAHMDWVRPGIMLYGATPFADLEAAAIGLKPAMSLEARLVSIREVASGDSVGPGAAWLAERPSRIALVSCGYADGYPRHAPSGTPVLVRGRRLPLAGRVSMDVLAVDVSDLPAAAVGDEVQLWGAQLPVDEVARAAGTRACEVLSKVAARVPRRYRGH